MLSPSPSALRLLRSTLSRFTSSLNAPNASSKLPLITFQAVRRASILADLRDIPAAHRNKKRVGRGASSGKGKTSGRGHKGQGQRSGLPHDFEGGQTPYKITNGPHGFENKTSKKYSPLNLDRIQSWIDQGRIDPTKEITFKELIETRCLHGIKDGVKLLGRVKEMSSFQDHYANLSMMVKNKEALKVPITITVSRASKDAIARIEELGGSITTRFFNKAGNFFVLLVPYQKNQRSLIMYEHYRYQSYP